MKVPDRSAHVSLRAPSVVAVVCGMAAGVGFALAQHGDQKALKLTEKVLPRQEADRALLLSSTLFTGRSGYSIVEFLDYECPVCRASAEKTYSKIATSPLGLAYTVAHFPLSIHKSAPQASAAMLVANKFGIADKLHHWLMRSSDLSSKATSRYVGTLGVSRDKWDAEVNSARTRQDVQDAAANARKLGVPGTPIFAVRTPQGKTTLVAGIDEALQYCKSAIAK